MFIDGDTRYIGRVDNTLIDKLAEISLKVNWLHHKFDRPETQLIEGRLCTLPYPIRNETHKIYTEEQLQLIDAALPVVDVIMTYFPGFKKMRGEVVNLLPGKQLTLHTDPQWFHKYSHRVHVPIITNLNCYQIFEDREVHLEKGCMYEINNRIMHSARNSSNEPRVHLIVDIISPEKAEEARNNKSMAIQHET